MKEKLTHYFRQALEQLDIDPDSLAGGIQLTRPKNPEHGDWSTNLALQLAGRDGANPRQWAERVLEALPSISEVRACRLAGPGFINLYLHSGHAAQVLLDIHRLRHDYGRKPVLDGQILVEYLSTNPTGPLHIGHGRLAVYGSALTALLAAAGQQVVSEYYINDSGRQIDILVLSVVLRAAAQLTTTPSIHAVLDQLNTLPIYQGDYLQPITAELIERHPQTAHRLQQWLNAPQPSLNAIAASAAQDAGDAQDALIDQTTALLRSALEEHFDLIRRLTLEKILDDIRDDLTQSAVQFDHWFSEDSIRADLPAAIEAWQQCPEVYSREGSLWFSSTQFGDDKDRVLIRRNGTPTYFAMDILYHGNKIARGYRRLINLFGADHHGYITRLRAAVNALYQAPAIDVSLVQFVRLIDDQQVVQMSTRSGQFVSLRQLRERIGCDALRFYFLLTDINQGLDFNLTLVLQRNNENPLYYIQYACVRCHQVLVKAAERKWSLSVKQAEQHLTRLSLPSECELIRILESYPEVIERAADQLEPAILIRYLRELAAALHANYTDQPYLVDDSDLRNARLLLISATHQVLSNALGLLKIEVPTKM